MGLIYHAQGEHISALHGRVRLIEHNVVTLETIASPWKDNLITTAGKVAILRRLGNKATKTNEGMITYGAVGTGTAVPVVGDTTLGTELARKALTSASVAGTTLTLRVFFSTSEGNGVWSEFGWFGEDASGTADSGTLFNHIQITKTKTVAKTVTVEQEIYF